MKEWLKKNDFDTCFWQALHVFAFIILVIGILCR